MSGFTPEEVIGASVMAAAQNDAARRRKDEDRFERLELRVRRLEEICARLERQADNGLPPSRT